MRVKWLKEGERNTKFFHNSMIQNRNSSRIQRLKTRAGNRVETRREIEAELTQHFFEILREDGGNRSQDIEQITRLVPRVVIGENNEMLNNPIGMQEVEEAVNQMALCKAPRPNGFMSNFFHFFWDLVKEDVLDIVEESRTKKWVLKAFNATFLTLIPKEVGADCHNKFRSIALCNVIYMIISKVIANRLKPLLPMLISPEQSGFVEGR